MTLEVLDYTGLTCPKPLRNFQKFLREYPDFKRIKVIATDPNSIDDFSAFEEFGVIEIISLQRTPESIIFEIKNKGNV